MTTIKQLLYRHIHNFKGFTFIEMVVVMGILATITGMTVISLSGLQRRTNLQATLTQLIAEIKTQQLRAMEGNTQGTGEQSAFGIYFQPNGYTLFKGSSYSASLQTNYTVNLETTIQFSVIAYPNSQIIFASGSGEITNYANGSNTITIQNTTNGDQKTISINKYGAITQIN